jgi:hypothetical protein
MSAQRRSCRCAGQDMRVGAQLGQLLLVFALLSVRRLG